MLDIFATFSATMPLARTKKGGARRGGAKVKQKMAWWQWREEKMALICAISTTNFALKSELNAIYGIVQLKLRIIKT